MNPEVGLVASFVAIVDRLISVVKTRQESRQHLLNDIIEPYFEELQIAYSAHVATLRKAKQMLEEGRPFPVVYGNIERLRAEDLILRDKVRQMAEAYEGVLPDAHVVDFFQNARCLFGYWSGDHSSGTLRVMMALNNCDGTYSYDFVIQSIGWVITAAEDRWRELSRQYALIRATYSQPISIAKRRGNSR